jgi:hypothetical protein
LWYYRRNEDAVVKVLRMGQNQIAKAENGATRYSSEQQEDAV